MNYRYRQKNQGVALITAMLIVALASIAAVAVVSRQQFDIRRSANLINGDQAYQLALGAEIFAKQVLTRDLTKGNVDNLTEDWAKPIQALDVAGGKVSGKIEDLQGRYNLNNLVNGTVGAYTTDYDEVERFKNLLRALDIPDVLAYVIADWIDSDINPDINGGAEDTVYTGLPLAYRAANTLMTSVSELRLVLISDQFKPQYYAKLAPFICALPGKTPINVNTAPAEVLTTLSKTGRLRTSAAQLLVDARKTKPFELASFQSALTSIAGLSASDAADIITDNRGAVSSSYFLLDAKTLFGKSQVQLYSEIKRTAAAVPTPGVSTTPGISVFYRAQGVL